MKASPKLERLLERGFEVLLMTDPVDEVILAEGREFDSAKLLNVSGDSVSVEDEAERKQDEKRLEELKPQFEPLRKRALQALRDVNF